MRRREDAWWRRRQSGREEQKKKANERERREGAFRACRKLVSEEEVRVDDDHPRPRLPGRQASLRDALNKEPYSAAPVAHVTA